MTSLKDIKEAWERSEIPREHQIEERIPWWVQEWRHRTIEIGPISGGTPPPEDEDQNEREETDESPPMRIPRGSGEWPVDESERDSDSPEGRIPRLPDEDRRQIEDSLGSEGLEVLAWYQPFHHSAMPWGIYLREKGLLYLADFLESRLNPRPDSIHESLLFLHSHEVCHGVIETVITHQELSTLRPAYVNRHRAVAIPWPNGLSSNQVEEALSNATAFRKHWPDSIGRVWEEFARSHQPRGYSDWEIAGGYVGFERISELFYGLSGNRCGLLQAPWMPLHKWARGQESDIPVFLVKDAPPDHGTAFAIKAGQTLLAVRLAEHPPPHFEIENTRGRQPKRRYSYPFERRGIPPFDPVPPTTTSLSQREADEVARLIDENKAKFLGDLKRQVIHLKEKYPNDGRLAHFNDAGEWIGPTS
jgi:hypothetical protein